MLNRFANTFFFGYLTKSKRLVRALIILEFIILLIQIIVEWEHDREFWTGATLTFLFGNFFISFVLEPFSSNSKNEIWIFIVWAILFGGFTAVMLDS